MPSRNAAVGADEDHQGEAMGEGNRGKAPKPAAPTIDAAPAPMNTSAKVPMNFATTLGVSEFDILISKV
jgi:hypothetical protein